MLRQCKGEKDRSGETSCYIECNGKIFGGERLDVTDSAWGKGVGGLRVDVTDTVRGKVVGWERSDITACKVKGVGVETRDVTVQVGKATVGIDVMLQNVQG